MAPEIMDGVGIAACVLLAAGMYFIWWVWGWPMPELKDVRLTVPEGTEGARTMGTLSQIVGEIKRDGKGGAAKLGNKMVRVGANGTLYKVGSEEKAELTVEELQSSNWVREPDASGKKYSVKALEFAAEQLFSGGKYDLKYIKQRMESYADYYTKYYEKN